MGMVIKFSEKDIESLDNLDSSDVERIDMRKMWGVYEVRVGKIMEKENSKGTPMVSIPFNIIAGEYEGQTIWYNQPVSEPWMFKKVAKMLTSLKTDVDLSSKNFVIDGEVDFDKYNEMLKAVYDDIKSEGYEYALEYKEGGSGWGECTITEVFEN